jgi:hypothetical protein
MSSSLSAGLEFPPGFMDLSTNPEPALSAGAHASRLASLIVRGMGEEDLFVMGGMLRRHPSHARLGRRWVTISTNAMS